ncbi:Nitrate/nitrite transporter [Klebsiella pneumoniae IS53]|nr:Nitrate/nitrite transporter [Klebsiella pneumoniae IS53]
MREAATDTAAALGFISAIGAIGGFFIPKAFGISLDLTGSPAGGDESVPRVLYCLRGDHLGGIRS